MQLQLALILLAHVNDTAEPAQQGERKDSEEYEQEEVQNEQEEDEETTMDM